MWSHPGGRMLRKGRRPVRPGRVSRTGEKQRKEHSMTTPSISAPLPGHTMGRALQFLLATVAVLALVTVAFVVGRVTVGSSPAPATSPAVSSQVPASTDSGICQQVGHYRSAAC